MLATLSQQQTNNYGCTTNMLHRQIIIFCAVSFKIFVTLTKVMHRQEILIKIFHSSQCKSWQTDKLTSTKNSENALLQKMLISPKIYHNNNYSMVDGIEIQLSQSYYTLFICHGYVVLEETIYILLYTILYTIILVELLLIYFPIAQINYK